MVMFYALVALCFSGTALAQIAGWGPCPKIETMPNFYISKIEGRWYEARRYFTTSEMGLKCIKYDFRHSEHGTMLLDATAIHRLSGHLGAIKDVTVRVADPAEPGKLIEKFPSSNTWGNYWILGTDYHSYMIGYNCLDLKFMNLKYVWISTRMQHPSKAIIEKALNVIDEKKLKKKLLLTTDQNDCVLKPFTDETETLEESTILF